MFKNERKRKFYLNQFFWTQKFWILAILSSPLILSREIQRGQSLHLTLLESITHINGTSSCIHCNWDIYIYQYHDSIPPESTQQSLLANHDGTDSGIGSRVTLSREFNTTEQLSTCTHTHTKHTQETGPQIQFTFARGRHF